MTKLRVSRRIMIEGRRSQSPVRGQVQLLWSSLTSMMSTWCCWNCSRKVIQSSTGRLEKGSRFFRSAVIFCRKADASSLYVLIDHMTTSALEICQSHTPAARQHESTIHYRWQQRHKEI